MGHSSVIIYAPDTMPTDIAAVLGIAGTDLQSLCTSLAINKWAKYKPVSYAETGRLNDDTTESQRKSANYGLEYIPTWSVIGKMLYFWLQQYDVSYNAPDCGIQAEYWHYKMPSGGIYSPFRLSDFAKNTTIGYYHYAHAPIGGLRYTSALISPSGYLSIVYDNDTEQSSMSIKLTDLRYDGGGQISLSGFYFGVALVRTSGASSSSAKRYVMTSDTAQDAIELGSHIYPVFLDSAAVEDFMANSDTQTFYAMPFLANDEIYATITKGGTTMKTFLSSFSGIYADMFVALWEREIITITRRYAEGEISALSSYRDTESSTRLLYYHFTITNNMGDLNLVAKYTLSVYKDDGVTLIKDKVVTGIVISYQAGYNSEAINSSIDLADVTGGLEDAAYVRVIVEVDDVNVVSKRSSSDVCGVTDGPSPWS